MNITFLLDEIHQVAQKILEQNPRKITEHPHIEEFQEERVIKNG